MKHYLLGLYEKSMPGSLSIREKLAAAAAAGFDTLELSIDETDEKLARLDWAETKISDLRKAQEETGMPLLSICLSGHRRFPLGDPDDQAAKAGMVIMEKAVKLAARLGVRIIQLAGYDVYYKPSTPETRERFARNLALAVEMAATYGVTLAFETMETEFMNTARKAMAWVERVQSPWLQVYPDLGNITNAVGGSAEKAAEDLRSARGHISAMHLKETVPGVFREVAYGAGHVDFVSGAKTAYGLGVRMFVGEFWHLGEENWPEVLASNNAFLRRALRQAVEALPGLK